MRVTVTGGAGFIGSNVAAVYLRDGHRVTVLDSLRRPGTAANLDWLGRLGGDRLEFVRGDVRDARLVHDLLAGPTDLVFHFAAQPAVTTSVERPREDLEINLLGTFNVLEAIRARQGLPPPALFFTSTNKVYGALERHATIETERRHRFADERLHASGVGESEPLDFHSPYGCSKGAADQYARDYARMYGLPIVVFRMSCIYGQRQFGNEDQGWLAHFLIALATQRPLVIYGDGKQVRDILHVDDLVRAFQLAHEHLEDVAGNVYNIGGGPANSVAVWAELREHLASLPGHVPEPGREDWRPGDQPVYVSDTTRARRDFGWTAEIGATEGIERLWRWVQAERDLIAETLGAAGGAVSRAAAVGRT
ncbi:GDP-mannose 4,6-dehydratase [soil metagenome]